MNTFTQILSGEHVRQYFSLLAIQCVSLGLALILLLNPTNAPPTVYANYAPYSGETCFATLDNGTTVFSSTTASALQQAVDAASPGMTVKAAGTCPGVAARSGVTQTVYVSQSLTIQGGYSPSDWSQSYPITQPTTLDALSSGRVLYLTGNISVTIDALRITGGNAYGLGGGGLYITATSVIVRQSTFITNTGGNGSNSTDQNVPGGNGGSGGAIYNDGSLMLAQSTLIGNTAGNGGYNTPMVGTGGMGGLGGAIYNSGSLVLNESTLSGNSAGNGGDNYTSAGVGGSGGAIYNTNTLTITSSSIDGNHAGIGGYTSPWWYNTTGGGGSGIFNSGILSVISTTLSNNGAGNIGDGGGISNQGILTVTNSIFTNNYAGAGNAAYHYGFRGGRGGGIYSNGTLTVQASVFTNNSAGSGASALILGGEGGSGGGIYSVGSLTVWNSTFTNNSSGAGGVAAAILSYDGDGGGIYSMGSLIASDSVFRNNVAVVHGTITETLGSHGGAIAASGGNATLNNNQIIANGAHYGGGLYLFDNALLTNTVIADNQSIGYGSGVVLAGNSAQLWHTTIARNSGGDGAGVYISGTMTLTNTIIVSQTVGITSTVGSTIAVNSVLWHGNSNGNVGGPGSVVITNPYTGSPDFVSPATGDYHLMVTSAAINRGRLTRVKTDLDGRPRDLFPDLGAYEYPFAQLYLNYLPLMMRNSPY